MAKAHWVLAVETGGTKLLARLACDDAIVSEARWPTTTPAAAEAAVVDFVQRALPADAALAAVGLAAFGPVVLDPCAANYGQLLPTPKPGWSGANLRAAFAGLWNVPVAIDTDVNAAALAEQALGSGRGCQTIAYVTVGTGIGAGLASGGTTLKGALHPEIGHVPVRRVAGDEAVSQCPFHPDCAEGLAAGPAVQARLAGRRLEDSPADFAIVADYLGQTLAMIVLAWSPHRIVAGGGVFGVPGLRAAAHDRMTAALGGYGVGPAPGQRDFVLAPSLECSGLEGALLMARSAIRA